MKCSRDSDSWSTRGITWLHRRPWQLGLAMLVLTSAALLSMTQLVVDDNPQNLLQNVNQLQQLSDLVEREFGSERNAIILLLTSDEPLIPEITEKLTEVNRRLSQLDDVQRVESPFDPQMMLIFQQNASSEITSELHKQLDVQQLLGKSSRLGLLLGDEGRRAIFVVYPKQNDRLPHLLDQLSEVKTELQNDFNLDVKLTGLEVIRRHSLELVQKETASITVVAAAVSFACCLLILRSIDLTLVVGLTSFTGLIWTLGTVAAFGLRMNALTTVMPVLVLIIGFTGAVHFVCELRFQQRQGMNVANAALQSILLVGPACWYSALTTAIGFLSLGVASCQAIREFGLSCACGTLLSYLSLVCCGPLLARVLVYSKPTQRSPDDTSMMDRLLERAIHLIERFHLPIGFAGIALVIGLAFLTTSLRPVNQVAEALPKDLESREALGEIDRHFAGSQAAYVLIDWTGDSSMNSVDPLSEDEQLLVQQDVEAAIDLVHEFRHPISYRSIAHALPAYLARLMPDDVKNRFYRPADKLAIVRMRHADVGTEILGDASLRLNQRLKEVQRNWPQVKLSLTGDALASGESLDQVTRELAINLGIAFAIIAFVMACAFRSLHFAAIAIVVNLLPLLVPACLILFLDSGVRISAIVTFSIFLGIAVDDTIHFIRRYEHELKQHGNRTTAIKIAFTKVGRALIITSVVIVVGFASVAFGRLPHNQLFAILGCTAMMTALASDLVLLPALLSFGKASQPAAKRGDHA